MTADERIEKLLNHFGQTIADLPAGGGVYHAYGLEHRLAAEKAALAWNKKKDHTCTYNAVQMNASYICHLADVIDRMEVALETALRILSMSCITCAENGDCDMSHCDYTIDDMFLSTYLE